MNGQKLQHIVIGAAIGIAAIVPLGAYLFVKSGIFNAGASHPHTTFTAWITHETMIHSVRHYASGISPPVWTNKAQLMAGFCSYESRCVACHGAVGVGRQTWVAGMEPQPPYLLDITQRFTPAQLFWIVKNGIKMTGMPRWDESMSDQEIWNVVAWLEESAKLSSQSYVDLRSKMHCGGPARSAGSPEQRRLTLTPASSANAH